MSSSPPIGYQISTTHTVSLFNLSSAHPVTEIILSFLEPKDLERFCKSSKAHLELVQHHVTFKNIGNICSIAKILSQRIPIIEEDIFNCLARGNLSAFQNFGKFNTSLTLKKNKQLSESMIKTLPSIASEIPFDSLVECFQQIEKNSSIPYFFEHKSFFDILYDVFKEQLLTQIQDYFPEFIENEDFIDAIVKILVAEKNQEKVDTLYQKLLMCYGVNLPFEKEFFVSKEQEKYQLVDLLCEEYMNFGNPSKGFDFILKVLGTLKVTYEKTDLVIICTNELLEIDRVDDALKMLKFADYSGKYVSFNDYHEEDEDDTSIDPEHPILEIESLSLSQVLITYLFQALCKVSTPQQLDLAFEILANKKNNGLDVHIALSAVEQKLEQLEGLIKKD